MDKMRIGLVIADLEAHAGGQFSLPPVLQPDEQFAFQDKKNMAAAAPMVGPIAGPIVHQAKANVTCFKRPPE